MTIIPCGISIMNLLFTSLVRKFFHSLNKSVSVPLQFILNTSPPLSLFFCFSLALSEVLYYLKTRADLCLCPAQRQVQFTVCNVRDELCAGLVFRVTETAEV